MKSYLAFFLVLSFSCSKTPDQESKPSDKISVQKNMNNKCDEVDSAPNLVDDNGSKQGHWTIYGIDSVNSNFPPHAKILEGNYCNDVRTGEWKFYKRQGKYGEIDSIVFYDEGRIEQVFIEK